MEYSKILGIILIVLGIYIFLLVLGKLSIKTKCRIAKELKEKGPFLVGIVGIWTIITLIISFPKNVNELSMLFNGSKSILEISQDAQISIIAFILFFLGSALYLIGRRLYKQWNCWEELETKEVW